MASTPSVELVLTCGSWQEAQRIADHLIDADLIRSAEFLTAEAEHVHVIMETAQHLFERIETEVIKMNGLESLNLKQIPVSSN